MQQTLEATCHFEPIEPADLLSAVRSLTARVGDYVIHDRIGTGFNTFLRWAVEDIEAARATQDSDTRCRYATNAVMSARRCLSCLVDQYLLRDAIALCKDAPQDPKKQSRVLIQRGLFDPLASEVLQRVIEKRNKAEHKYCALDFKEAQDIVQIVRGTVESITNKSSPFNGPCLFGSFSRGSAFGPKGSQFWFHGWSDPALILMTFDTDPWLGVIIPSSKTVAVVRRIAFNDLTVNQLLEILSAAEEKCGYGSGGCSADVWRGIARAAGLMT